VKLTLSEGDNEFSIDISSCVDSIPTRQGGLPCIVGTRWPVYLALVEIDIDKISKAYGFDERRTKELTTFVEAMIHLFDNRLE
jgi:hypothetical protein